MQEVGRWHDVAGGDRNGEDPTNLRMSPKKGNLENKAKSKNRNGEQMEEMEENPKMKKYGELTGGIDGNGKP